METLGIEPKTSYMQRKQSSTELHPPQVPLFNKTISQSLYGLKVTQMNKWMDERAAVVHV